jgi:uncharacterized protein (TIGR03437 family)
MKVLSLFCLCAGLVFAQGSAAVVGGGYNAIAPMSVAPGQVITIFVTGVGNVTQKTTAGKPPLTNALAGITAVLVQGTTTIPSPILAVFSLNDCQFTLPGVKCASVTAVTVQIPFELHANIPGSLSPVAFLDYLQVSDSAGNTAVVSLNAQLDAIHVLRPQDTVMALDMAQATSSTGGIVAHANGTLVDPLHPAQVGEELVMYAVGLGATNPPTGTGAASPLPAVAAAGTFVVNFDYRPNAPPTPGTVLMNEWFDTAPPPFAGLTPGFVGLYQVNFIVPPMPTGTLPCVRSVGLGANPFASVLSNLTVTVVGRTSFDGAAICVGPAVS